MGLCQSQQPDPSNFQAREFSVGKTVGPASRLAVSRDETAERKAEVIFTCLAVLKRQI